MKFQLNLDVFDLCTEELQKKLIPMRDRFKEREEREVEKMEVNYFNNVLHLYFITYIN